MTQNFKALSTGLIIGLVSITSGSIYAGGLTAQQVTQITGGNNTITTAVPFLNIAPDSRTQGMADVGVATSPDANSSAVNPAKLAFIDKPAGFAVSYTPWLRQLVPDMNLALRIL